MSDPHPPEQPSFNLPPGSQPPGSQPPGAQPPGAQPPGQPSGSQPATTPMPTSQPGTPGAAPSSGAGATPPPPPVPAAGGSGIPEGPGGHGGPSGFSTLPDPAREGAGFFTALFDFSFTNFVTPILVRFVYVLATVALVVMWLVFLVTGFATSLGAGLLALVLGPVLLVIYLAVVRMTLEFYLSVVRMSEDIHKRLPHA
ncbi:DUF4282 domain-containing protein [Terrabacter sp. NPDC080008]|uniref:DUF4282 domain-containing protein n=1 Tax=Terrabacter sp. NPDC080008 TaxID=3155176 RepID=UPI0034501D10